MEDSCWYVKPCIQDAIDGEYHDQFNVKYVKDFPSFNPIKGIKLNEITNAVFSDPEKYCLCTHNCYHSRKHILQKIGYETPTFLNTLMNEIYVSPVVNDTIEKTKKKLYTIVTDSVNSK